MNRVAMRATGSFVAATPTDYHIGQRVRFHENLIVAGRRPEKRVLALEERLATDGEAAALQIAASDVDVDVEYLTRSFRSEETYSAQP